MNHRLCLAIPTFITFRSPLSPFLYVLLIGSADCFMCLVFVFTTTSNGLSTIRCRDSYVYKAGLSLRYVEHLCSVQCDSGKDQPVIFLLHFCCVCLFLFSFLFFSPSCTIVCLALLVRPSNGILVSVSVVSCGSCYIASETEYRTSCSSS